MFQLLSSVQVHDEVIKWAVKCSFQPHSVPGIVILQWNVYHVSPEKRERERYRQVVTLHFKWTHAWMQEAAAYIHAHAHTHSCYDDVIWEGTSGFQDAILSHMFWLLIHWWSKRSFSLFLFIWMQRQHLWECPERRVEDNLIHCLVLWSCHDAAAAHLSFSLFLSQSCTASTITLVHICMQM